MKSLVVQKAPEQLAAQSDLGEYLTLPYRPVSDPHRKVNEAAKTTLIGSVDR